LMGTGIENGRRVIVVINGCASQQERADESAKLLEWGLKRFENKKLLTAGREIEAAPVVFGLARTVPLAVDQDVIMTVPKLADSSVHLKLKYNAPLPAPIKKGQQIGTLSVEIPDSPAKEIPVLAAADVPEMTFFAKTIDKARQMLLGN
jgi:serine-type D-Ala-D-Ala carboxypeptidase (penicillin-binding protein 5/6)